MPNPVATRISPAAIARDESSHGAKPDEDASRVTGGPSDITALNSQLCIQTIGEKSKQYITLLRRDTIYGLSPPRLHLG